MRTPLTEAEHARLRMLMKCGPVDNRLPVDDRLIEFGLCDTFGGLTKVLMEQVGPEGIEPYYERDGSVNPVSYPTIGQPDVLDPANAPQRSKR